MRSRCPGPDMSPEDRDEVARFAEFLRRSVGMTEDEQRELYREFYGVDQ